MRHRWRFSTFETIKQLCVAEACLHCGDVRKSKGRSWRYRVVESVVPNKPGSERIAWRRGCEPCLGDVAAADRQPQAGINFSAEASDK